MGSARALWISNFLNPIPGRFLQTNIEEVKKWQFRTRNGVGKGSLGALWIGNFLHGSPGRFLKGKPKEMPKRVLLWSFWKFLGGLLWLLGLLGGAISFMEALEYFCNKK